jgi:Leucine-rich repeat (LRR) protein
MPISSELLEKINNQSYQEELLSLPGENIDDTDVGILVEALRHNNYIKHIDLTGNLIGDNGAALLAQIELEELNLTQNQVTSEGAFSLSKSKVKTLNITANPVGDAGAKALSLSTHLESLEVRECNITNSGAREVLKSPTLKKVNLSTNQLSDDCLSEFSSNSTLEALDLSQNKFTDKAAIFISQHKKIKSLDLSSNYIRDEGVGAIASCQSLIELDLSQNPITEIGFRKLFNSSLKRLTLFNNGITFDVQDPLPSNRSLVNLSLSYNHLNDKCDQVLKDLASIPTLKELDLTENDLTEKGALILLQYKTNSLEKINLKRNYIEDTSLVEKAYKISRYESVK